MNWNINPILKGDFLVDPVVIPHPSSAETTSQLVVSPGIHLSVMPFSGMKTAGILPIAIGQPIALLAITLFVYRRRRQQIDLGGS
jgi:hypothetical protein